MTRTLKDFQNKIKSGEILQADLLSVAENVLQKHSFLNAVATWTTNEKERRKWKDLPFKGIPYLLKDNISLAGHALKAGSKILENYVCPYDATVTKLLRNAGFICLAKANLDELGMGGTGLYSASGIVRNPWDTSRIAGGSSSGSAVSVALEAVPFSIGTDTGDSIRKPASYCGTIGFKPSYGLISRYGVVPYAPSLDTVGFFTNNVADCETLFQICAQKDQLDQSMTLSKFTQLNFRNQAVKQQKFKLAVFRPIMKNLKPDVRDLFEKALAKISNLKNVHVETIAFPQELLEALLPIYSVISFAEAASTHANLTGLQYGNTIAGKEWSEMVLKTRSAGFGRMVKRRFVIGAFSLNDENQTELFIKAQQVRSKINTEVKRVFEKYDGFVHPCSNSIAPLISEQKNRMLVIEDALDITENNLLLANFGGLPSISLPMGQLGYLPLGLSLTMPTFKDQMCLQLAQQMEKALAFSRATLGKKDAE